MHEDLWSSSPAQTAVGALDADGESPNARTRPGRRGASPIANQRHTLLVRPLPRVQTSRSPTAPATTERRADLEQPAAVEALREVTRRLEMVVSVLEAASAGGSGAAGVGARHGPAPLTARQLEILSLVADGVPTAEIARGLWLSVATVRNHIARTLTALDAHSRVGAVARARQLGLLP
jgi:DNA-binding CsgD family transcriptional regulator